MGQGGEAALGNPTSTILRVGGRILRRPLLLPVDSDGESSS